MSPREYAPLLAAVVVAVALAAGAASFDAVEQLDGTDRAAGPPPETRDRAGGESRARDRPDGNAPPAGSDRSQTEETDTTSGDTPAVLLLLVAGAVAVGLLVVRVGAGDDVVVETHGEADEETSDDGPDTTRSPAPENRVTAAWLALARHVGGPWWRQTPRETASAARAAGHPAERVDRLRETFERVRYGGAEPTPERERWADAALAALDVDSADDVRRVENPNDANGKDSSDTASATDSADNGDAASAADSADNGDAAGDGDEGRDGAHGGAS